MTPRSSTSGTIARATDIRRVPEVQGAGPLGSLAGAVAERVPGLRRVLPARRDVFGRTQVNPGILNGMFNPATASPDLRATAPRPKWAWRRA